MKIYKYLDSSYAYGAISKFFHWSRLFLLLCIYGLAWFGESLFFLHKIFGSILFLLIIVNILWRFLNTYPKSSAQSVVERNIQYVIYILMYLFLLIIPIFGYLGSRYGFNMYFFWIPSIYDINMVNNFITHNIGISVSDFSKMMGFLHKVMVNFILLSLIAAHVGAIFVNLIFNKKNDIKKMI